MAQEPDAGLVKRGLVLLIVMLLLVSSVLFILFQGRPNAPPAEGPRAEEYAWCVAVPSAAFPSSVSWGALYAVSGALPSPVGWEIRHNAAATLARSGSDDVRWPLFHEMLDLQRNTANVRQQLQGGQESPEGTARALVIVAMKALADWHTKRRELNRTEVPVELAPIYDSVDRLADSPIAEIREQAQKTRATFFRQPTSVSAASNSR